MCSNDESFAHEGHGEGCQHLYRTRYSSGGIRNNVAACHRAVLTPILEAMSFSDAAEPTSSLPPSKIACGVPETTAKKPKTLRQTTPDTFPELAHGAQDEAQGEVKVVEPLADGPQDEAQSEAADDAPHQLEFDEHGYPCIFNHFLCSHGVECAAQSDAHGAPLIFKRFMTSHAADTSPAKEETAEKNRQPRMICW